MSRRRSRGSRRRHRNATTQTAVIKVELVYVPPGKFLGGGGHYCGYVYLPLWHRWSKAFKKGGYDNVYCPLELTFGRLTTIERDGLVSVKFGFDTAHMRDEMMICELLEIEFPPSDEVVGTKEWFEALTLHARADLDALEQAAIAAAA